MDGLQILVDSVWNFYFKNDEKINYPAIVITLSIITLTSSFAWYYILSRNKLKIKTTYIAQIPEYVGGVLGQVTPYFSSYITNKSRRNIFISHIAFKINKKIRGNNEFQYINMSTPVSFPIRIESSDRYIYQCDMVSLDTRLFNQSADIKWFKVIVYDTFGKKHKSKKVKVEVFRRYMNNILNH